MLKFFEKEVLTSQPSSKYIRTHKEMIKCCSCKFVQWQNSSDLPQQFRNERHDGNFQQHSIQVQSLADMLGDSHGLLGGGCAMWSLKIDGRIPSFNEIGDHCSSSSYRSYYQHDLILQQPHLISSCSYPNDAGNHKKTKWKAKTSFIWKEEAKLATNWYYVQNSTNGAAVVGWNPPVCTTRSLYVMCL